MKILIVDDDAAALRMIVSMLQHNGHTVIASETPYGVSALVLRHMPDVVVLDVRMPGLNGVQLAHVIAELELPRPPTVALWSSLGLPGAPTDVRVPDGLAWGGYPGGLRVTKGAPLFPRITPTPA